MKISKILIGTIISISITTLIVIGCLFINQIFSTESNIACETYQLSNSDSADLQSCPKRYTNSDKKNLNDQIQI